MAEQNSKAPSPRWAWEAYRPSAEAPWNLQRVGHLYRRAAFGATFAELEAGLKMGPDRAIDALVKGGPNQADFDRSTEPLRESIARANNGNQAQTWWLYRMLYTPHPLQEKLTLFWHNHFATSNAKVQNARFMLGQYELMRHHALGNFATLLQEISKDPAMMIWLDTRDSKKGNPNENYARELMELFSLGIGHYTEQDIREAARAFTGWEVQGDEGFFRASQHDDGEKTVFGRKGNWKGEDIVRLCLDQKACASFIVTKLFRSFVSETLTPTPELIEPLAMQFRQSNYDFGALVQTMLRSNLFFSAQAYRSRIKSPVSFGLGIVRAMEARLGTTNLSTALQNLGQNVFSPPSVKGWDGGQAWLNGQTLLFRQNLSLSLSSTEDVRFGNRCDPAALVRKHGKKSDEEIVAFFLDLFLQGDVPAVSRSRLAEYQQKAHKQAVPVYWTAADAADHRVRALCHLVLTLPEYQLD
jgi:uncharacterized protein (DUF1800 family)